MPGENITNLAQAIKPWFLPNPAEGIFYNSFFLKNFGAPMPSHGGTAFKWKFHSGTSSSTETFTEDQAPMAASNETYVDASLDYIGFRSIIQVTGDLKRALAREEGRYFAAIDEKMQIAQRAVRDLMETTFMATSGAGILNAVDSTGTYAGVAKGSVTSFASVETAGGGASLTLAMLEDTVESLRDNDRGASPDLIISRPRQATKYKRISGVGTTNTLVRNEHLDLGTPPDAIYYENMPWRQIPDMTNTEVLVLQTADFSVIEHGAMDLVEKFVSSDSQQWHLQGNYVLVCRQPNFQGKVTNLAT